ALLCATDWGCLAAHKLSPRDIKGVVPVSAFYWVERRGVAPDRDMSVWGTDPAVWVDASPAHHLRDTRPAPPPPADVDPLCRRRRRLAPRAERRGRCRDESRRSDRCRDREDRRS